jgi:hypothetical protein
VYFDSIGIWKLNVIEKDRITINAEKITGEKNGMILFMLAAFSLCKREA